MNKFKFIHYENVIYNLEHVVKIEKKNDVDYILYFINGDKIEVNTGHFKFLDYFEVVNDKYVDFFVKDYNTL